MLQSMPQCIIGGGLSGDSEDSCTVMKYDVKQNEWSTLLRYSAELFAMSVEVFDVRANKWHIAQLS